MMRCLSPVTIKDKELNKFVEVPCGKCLACRANRRREWTCRLMAEVRYSTSAYFLTLTYSPDNLYYDHQVAVLNHTDIQLFLKRLRKQFSGIKYLVVGEYGEHCTEHPHYHLFLFGLPVDYDPANLEKFWSKGFIHVGTPTSRSAMYLMKYCLKDHGDFSEDDIRQQHLPYLRCSHGIGLQWLQENKQWLLRNKSPDGYPLLRQDLNSYYIPRYYRKKLEPIKSIHTRARIYAQMEESSNRELMVLSRIYENPYKFIFYRNYNFCENTQKIKHINNKL